MPLHEEYVLISQNGIERRIALHDYRTIFNTPGLFDAIMDELLNCQTPDILSSLLIDAIMADYRDPSDLVILEIGSGNGMMAEALAQRGVQTIVGIDILEEAALATQRDRPGLYHTYLVADLCNLSPFHRAELECRACNCLVCASSLTADHVPIAAFIQAYNLISIGAWVVFNMQHPSIPGYCEEEYARFIDQISASGILIIHQRQTYRHRLSVSGQAILCNAFVGQKGAHIAVEI
jgi:SAM-dependent methyltransferase